MRSTSSRLLTRPISRLSMIVIVAMLSLMIPHPSIAASKGNQIRFMVSGSGFKYLKIVGDNQDGNLTTWKVGNGKGELLVAETANYWWKGTIVLTFETTKFGMRSCVIDYLKNSADNMVPVTYTEGSGCSGDSGSAGGVLKAEVEIFYRVLFSEDDSLRLVKYTKQASNGLGCASAIADGLSANGITGSVVKVIKVGNACKGLVLGEVNKILKRYSNRVEFK
jgi:hypothetical protein